MFKNYQLHEFRGFKGILSNIAPNLVPVGYVPDMQNMTVTMEKIAQNIKIPSELSLYWEAWETTHAYILGDVVTITAEDYFLVCTTAGTSGGTEPTGAGTDGTVEWGLGGVTTDPIISFYRCSEWAEIFAIQIGTTVVLFEGVNQASGHIFSNANPVSFASGADNLNYLYIMHYVDGLWKYSHPLWFDMSSPEDPIEAVIGGATVEYSGGTPPLSQKILAWKNRLWAYGWLKEGLDLTGAVSRIHWSEVPTLPEDQVEMEEVTYKERPEVFEYEVDPDTKRKIYINNLEYDNHGAEYFDPFYFIDVSSIGADVITGVVPYEQALYLFTPENVYNLTFYTTYNVTLQQIASKIDGIPQVYHSGTETWIRNFIAVGKGIFYIGAKGLYVFSTPTPVKISEPIQNLIDLVIDDPKGVAYFNDRVWFALSDEVWVFSIVNGTWEKYVYPFQIETIWASDHVYATTTLGKVYKLDTEGATYLSWYIQSPDIDLGDLYLRKRPEDITVHHKVPSASSTMSILMKDNVATSKDIATNSELYISGQEELLNEKHYKIHTHTLKFANFKLSGSGEVKILGYDVNFKLHHRRRV
jgi:hypothetical protein